MLLKQAIADAIAECELRERSELNESDAAEVLTVVERFLRHNGFERAADALHSEHMP